MKVLIVDDEVAARNLLSIMLEEHFPELQVVDMAIDVPSAVIAVNKHQPDLIFLDVNMPGQKGFQLLDYFETPDFQIIFTTAYSEYALKAFEVSAVDYLIKPLQISKLKLAVEKVLRSNSRINMGGQFNILKETLQVKHIRKIALPVTGKVLFVELEDIIYLQAEGAYTHVVTKGQKIFLSKNIKEFEYILNEDVRFFRIHRSYIINTHYIRQYVKHEGTSVLMENEETLPVARERKQAFEELIRQVLIGHTLKS